MNSTLEEWAFTHPPQFEAFWFEKIDLNSVRIWALNHRTSSTVYIAIAYLLLTVLGQQWMKNQKPFQLDGLLLFWNIFISSLSIFALWRGIPEFIHILSLPNGFYRSACLREGLSEPAVFMGYLFAFSKFLHMGDTAFLVLRKKRITFLHCFHHATTAVLVFYAFPEAEPISRWLAVINFTVHVFMYSYFAILGLGFHLPKIVKMFITGSEIMHFIVGLYVNVFTLLQIANGQPCARTWTSIKMNFVMGPLYLILFGRFFYTNYLTKRKLKTK